MFSEVRPTRILERSSFRSPNEMVSEKDVQAAIDLLARYIEEAHADDYVL